jgi:hypothetical protein
VAEEERAGIPQRRRRVGSARHLTHRVGQDGGRQIGQADPRERSCGLVGNGGTAAEDDIDTADVDGVGVVLVWGPRFGLGRRLRVRLVKVVACGVMVVMATGAVVVAVGVLGCVRGMQVEMWTEVVSRRFGAAVAVAEGGG